MKHVETNFLIYDLARQGNKKKFYSAFKFLFTLIVLSSLYIVLYLLNVDLRYNLQSALSLPFFSIFYIQMMVFSTGSVLGSYLLYKQAIPGQTEKLSYRILSFLFYLMWLSLFIVLGVYAYQDYIAGFTDAFYMPCIKRTLLAILLPFSTAVYFVKQGYVIEKKKAALASIFTAFSFAGFVNLFVCPENHALHILCSHHLVIFPIIIVLFGLIKLIPLKKGL